MKAVRQLDKYGCTIACLAMITGHTYFEIREILHQRIERLLNQHVGERAIGLNCVPLQKALVDFFGIPCRFIKFTSLTDLKNNCILYICPLEGCYSFVHAVVFDNNKKSIIDPEGRLSNLNDHNVLCCLEILQT